MSQNSYNINSYTRNQPEVRLPQPPIKAKRNPTNNDRYEIGQEWINIISNAVFIVTSYNAGLPAWTNITGGGAVFNALTVQGAVNLNTVGAGVTNIGTGGTGAVNIGNATGNTTVTGNMGVTGNIITDTGALIALDGNLELETAGNKITIAAGANASIGTATLVAGTVTVATTAVTAASKIFVTANTVGGTQGILSVPTASIVAATSFVINSSSNLDTSSVNWWLIN